MELLQWLEDHDARLHITLEATYDPKESDAQWRCEISGFPYPDKHRPATFIGTYSNTVTAVALTPDEAVHIAVRKLRGKKLEVIAPSRNEVLIFPQDLTI